MDGCKLASVAGMITMATSVFVEYSVPILAQVQPGSQPGQRQPDRPAMTPPVRGMNEQREDGKSFFALREESAQAKLDDLARQLAQMEERMKETSQQLVNQINSARLLSGEQKVNALTEVVQGLAQQHVQMNEHLTQMREAITGKVSGRIQGIPEPRENPDDMIDLEKELKKDPLNPDKPKEPKQEPGQPGHPGDPKTDPGAPR
jgi:hypothetical protein